MYLETFEMERMQSVWENRVKINLTESGVHPFSIKELLNEDEIENLLTGGIGYGQSNGTEELRTLISITYNTAGPENILVTNGSSEANYIAVWSMLEPGDELILMLPNYMQIWGIARSFGVNVKPFYLKEDLNWQPDPEEIKSLISPKTKMIAVCNPNNPTGAVLTEENMQVIIDLAKEADAWVYSDEVYRGVELDGDCPETPSFLGKYDKTVVCNGLSKAYALPGLRIGWLAGPPETIEKAWSYHDYTSISTGVLTDKLARYALKPETRIKILARNRGMLRENLKILKDWIDKNSGIYRFIPPQAGGMAFLKYDFDINSTEFIVKMREKKDVFVVPGDHFGIDKYIRIGFGTTEDYLKEGLDLIDEAVKDMGIK